MEPAVVSGLKGTDVQIGVYVLFFSLKPVGPEILMFHLCPFRRMRWIVPVQCRTWVLHSTAVLRWTRRFACVTTSSAGTIPFAVGQL